MTVLVYFELILIWNFAKRLLIYSYLWIVQLFRWLWRNVHFDWARIASYLAIITTYKVVIAVELNLKMTTFQFVKITKKEMKATTEIPWIFYHLAFTNQELDHWITIFFVKNNEEFVYRFKQSTRVEGKENITFQLDT